MQEALDRLTLMVLLAAAVLALGPSVWRLAMLRRRRFCPGPRAGLARRVLLDVWLVPQPCGYDLTGLPATAGRSTCPECGTAVQNRLALVMDRRSRWRRWMILALVLAAGGLNVSAVRSGRWVEWMPTTALIALEHLPYEHRPTRLRRQLNRRLSTSFANLTPVQERLLIAAMVNDLRDDETQWNASRAMDVLARFGARSLPALHEALSSPDLQQRQLAAHMLREHEGVEPSAELLRVTIEGLRNDRLFIGNARAGIRYLLEHSDLAEPFLARGLSSDDWQERFLCAAILGYAGCRAHIVRATEILVEELRDDQKGENAKIATGALFGFGDAVAPLLCELRQSEDAQQRALVRAILADLEAAAAGEPQAQGPWHRHPGTLRARNIRVPWWWR